MNAIQRVLLDSRTSHRQQRIRATLLVYAAAQFVVLTVAAMLVYPGGAQFALESDHYGFFENFFSDLGATETYSGRSNLASHVIFIIALVTAGLALIGFSSTWRSVIAGEGRGRAAGIASQFFASVSGIGFVGVAATPWDHVLDAHNLFVKLAFGVLLFYFLCLIWLQLTNGWRKFFLHLNLVYLVVLVCYVVILFAGPSLDTHGGLRFQVAAQKVIVYATIVNLGAQAFGIRQRLSAATPLAVSAPPH